MPLDNFITRPDYSRQLKQYTNTNATFSGATNILQKFSVKDIEIDTAGANDGDALIYDVIANKFSPNTPGTFGSRVIGGLLLSYKSGLTYNISEGTFRISSTLYGYTGGTINIISGLTSGSRFDVVFITSAATPLVSAGTTSINPSIPQINISGGELQVGIIFVPASFSGGTGTSIIQSTGSTFEFNNTAASAGIQRQGGVGAVASGDYSFASNYEAKASGNYSSAIGYYAEATGLSQTVVGQYNTPDEGFFIVGNGTAPGSRSNAFRVTTGGSAYVTNKLFVSNIEIETTGASNGQALIYDGTKFKPQNLTGGTGGGGGISGLTSAGTGFLVISSITNNILVHKAISGGPGIYIYEFVESVLSAATTADTGTLIFTASTNLQQVTDNGAITTNPISAYSLNLYDQVNPSFNFKIDASDTSMRFFGTDGIEFFNIDSGNINLGATNNGSININLLTATRTFNLPDKSGTFALLDDVTGGTGGVVYMDLTTAQGGGPFTVGQWYRIPVSSRTTVTEANNPTTYGDIVLMGVDTNKLSNDGYLLAINADYQDVGDYTDADTIAGITTGRRRGVVPYGHNSKTRDVLIYDNTHWLCTADYNNTRLLSELQDTNYFTALTKDYTTRNGYIIEADKITYDITTDTILSRQDKRGNVVYDRDSAILEYFRFGDDNVKDNFILKPIGKLNILNRPKNYLKFNTNKLLSLSQIYANPTTFIDTANTVNISLSGCVINEYNFYISESTGIVANNTSFDNLITNTEPLTLTISSSSIDLTNRWHYNEIRLKSGTTYNGVPISAITSNAPYNITLKFRPDPYTTPTPTIVFRNNTNLKTEGGLDATISNQYDSVEFTFLSGGFTIQKNIYNYV